MAGVLDNMGTLNIDDFLQHSFDFLIIGGGTAGLTLAARLSEDPDVQVGVIEAGISRLGDPKVELPSGVGMILNDPDYDWRFQSTPQEGTNGRVFHMARGKMLGGSSGINFMAYGRPCAGDVDDWSKKLGIRGWSWSELLPYYKKSEKLELDQPNIKDRDLDSCPMNEELHGTEGGIHTSMNVWQAPFEKALLPALDAVSGLPRPGDPYNGSHVGFYRSLFATDRTKKPIRSYAANGYLAPVAERPNLKILTNTLVSKIIIESGQHQPVARGIEIQHAGTSHSVFTKKEVILSAGSFQSPQLLELSGVGDPKVLAKFGIPCVIPNNDVGNNLQDHTMTPVVYELAPGLVSLDSLFQDPALLKEHLKLYAESGSGAPSGCISLTGFIPYSSQVDEQELEDTRTKLILPLSAESQPSAQNTVFQRKQQEAIMARMSGSQSSANIQFICIPANYDIERGHANCAKLMSGAPAGHNGCYSIIASNMYPVSRGSVHIQSSNPLDAPLIDPGFLRHPADVDILAAAVRFADRVFQSSQVRDQVGRRVDPPPEVDLENKEAAKEIVRERVVSYHHALGTCAMGQVVDERLRVKGVQGLRVVDASVLPMHISTAIMATVYATAEKAADLIKQDYQTNGSVA